MKNKVWKLFKHLQLQFIFLSPDAAGARYVMTEESTDQSAFCLPLFTCVVISRDQWRGEKRSAERVALTLGS